MNREALVKEFRKQSEIKWDIIVIGGGATGLGSSSRWRLPRI